MDAMTAVFSLSTIQTVLLGSSFNRCSPKGHWRKEKFGRFSPSQKPANQRWLFYFVW